MSDPDLQISGGGSGRTDPEIRGGGGAVWENFFRPFGPRFGLKIRGSRTPRAPPLAPPLISGRKLARRQKDSITQMVTIACSRIWIEQASPLILPRPPPIFNYPPRSPLNRDFKIQKGDGSEMLLKKWICVLSVFISIILIYLITSNFANPPDCWIPRISTTHIYVLHKK